MINSDYLNGYKDGWHEAVTEMQIKIHNKLQTRSDSYRQEKILNQVFKWIGELDKGGNKR